MTADGPAARTGIAGGGQCVAVRTSVTGLTLAAVLACGALDATTSARIPDIPPAGHDLRCADSHGRASCQQIGGNVAKLPVTLRRST